MERKITIGKWETVAIMVNLISVKVFLGFPRRMAEDAGSAGWIMMLYISLLAFAAFYFIARLYTKFEGKDLLDIGQHICGSPGRIIVGALIIAFLLFDIPIYVRIFTENMKIVALTSSPISYVSFFMIACMVAGAYIGIEAIARYHAIVVPIIAAGYLTIIAGVLPYFKFDNLLPILGTGANAIFISGALRTGIFAELLILFLFLPYIKSHSYFKSAGYTALGISSIILVLGTFVYLGVIPMPGALDRILPIYHLTRLINFGRFFQRVESLFAVIWATSGLMYMTVGLYFLAFLFQKMFGLKHYKPLILPFAAIIFTLSLLPDSLVQATTLDKDITSIYGWIPAFALPVLLLAVARFIKRKVKKKPG